MSAGKISRVKRRLLRQVIADNVETIRGLPPRHVRPGNRLFRVWARRAPALLLLLLAGSTWVASNPSPPDTIAPAQIVVRAPRRSGAAPVIDSLQRVDSSVLSLDVQRVILDAGHGGSDPGAVTAAVSMAEKDITLDIARRLQDLLRKNGFQVVTTRNGDDVVPLRERARIANESDGDIFVSIHVNAIVKHTASRGVETYFLGPANDPVLTRLAAQENRASGYSVADMRRLLDGIYADARRSESQRLAGAIQTRLHAGLKRTDSQLENWGVKRAPFLVLVATDMPAVLAEVGCLSNPVEAALLGRGEYRQEIATALFEGIRAYASARDTKHGV